MSSPDKIYATDLPSLNTFDAGQFKVHLNWEGVKNTFSGRTNKSEMMRVLFADPMLDFSSHMQMNMGRWQINGAITTGSDVELPSIKEYFEMYNRYLEPYNMVAQDTLFNNHKMVTTGKQVLGVMVLEKSRLTTYNNTSYSFTADRYKGLSQKIEAPTLDDIEGAHYEYFRDILRMQLLATTALAQCVTGKPLSDRKDFLLTDYATYMYNEQEGAGSRVKERIVLTDTHVQPAVASDETVREEGDIFSADFAITEQKVMIDDVIGSPQMQTQLRNVVKAFKHPEVMKKWGVSMSQGVLLYGPPGTGKTMAAQALANELEGELWEIQVNNIKNKWLGGSEKNIQELFDEAAKKTVPTVMIWDEIDAIIGRDREGGSSQDMEAVRGIFKREAARLADRAPNVILVGTTNHIDRIDDAILRAGRFDTKIYMDLPNDDSRLQLLSSKIASVVTRLGALGHALYSPDINMQRLAVLTSEFSGAALSEVLIRAQRKKAFEEAEGKQPGPITQQDLEYEIRLLRLE